MKDEHIENAALKAENERLNKQLAETLNNYYKNKNELDIIRQALEASENEKKKLMLIIENLSNGIARMKN